MKFIFGTLNLKHDLIGLSAGPVGEWRQRDCLKILCVKHEIRNSGVGAHRGRFRRLTLDNSVWISSE